MVLGYNLVNYIILLEIILAEIFYLKNNNL